MVTKDNACRFKHMMAQFAQQACRVYSMQNEKVHSVNSIQSENVHSVNNVY